MRIECITLAWEDSEWSRDDLQTGVVLLETKTVAETNHTNDGRRGVPVVRDTAFSSIDEEVQDDAVLLSASRLQCVGKEDGPTEPGEREPCRNSKIGETDQRSCSPR